jgi:hypothetical protein
MSHTETRRATVAAGVLAEMDRQNITTAELSAATHIDPPTLIKRLNGDNPFYLHELKTIAVYLGLPAWKFIQLSKVAA